MVDRDFLIAFVDIVVAAAALASFMRSDRGIMPEDRLPAALGEPLNGYQSSKREATR